MLGELRDVDPGEVTIGMPVQVEFLDFPADDQSPTGWSNYAWVPADRAQNSAAGAQNSAADAQGSAERAQGSLPPLTIDATPTFVVSSALATRDFQDVHHDRDLARQRGSRDIFVNILTDTGLVERFVTDWAGPGARITSIALKLGVPWYAYDALTFTGDVVAVDGDQVTIAVVGTNSLGKHVISTVTATLATEGKTR